VTRLALLAAAPDEEAPKPQYDEKGRLIRPADCREWVFLSAGCALNYSPLPGSHELFTDVFVQLWAYNEFANSGKWPEKCMFVIDGRDSASRSSINQRAHDQTDLMGLAVEVKDSGRNPDKWTNYGFDSDGERAEALPKGSCWSRQDARGAVAHMFVQFCRTLKAVAKKFGTYNEGREQVTEMR